MPKLPLQIVFATVPFVYDYDGTVLYRNESMGLVLIMAGQFAGNEKYTLGTKTERRTTAKLAKGDRVLTWSSPSPRADDPRRVEIATGKTHSVVRTVYRVDFHLEDGAGLYGRAQRRYTVFFTDGTLTVDLAPIRSWDAVL